MSAQSHNFLYICSLFNTHVTKIFSLISSWNTKTYIFMISDCEKMPPCIYKSESDLCYWQSIVETWEYTYIKNVLVCDFFFPIIYNWKVLYSNSIKTSRCKVGSFIPWFLRNKRKHTFRKAFIYLINRLRLQMIFHRRRYTRQLKTCSYGSSL